MGPRILTRRTVGGLAFVLVASLISLLSASSLPGPVTTHWNAAGVPDDTLPKQVVLLGGPGLVLGTVLLFEVIPRVDPLADNIESFRPAYDALAALLAAFMVYFYGFVIAWNLGYGITVQQAVAPAIAVLYFAVGSLLKHAERNWFVGIRTPWTLSSAAVWRDTHDRAATLFKLASVIAFGGLVFPEYFVYFLAGPAAGIAVFATVYSYVAYRRTEGGQRGDVIQEPE